MGVGNGSGLFVSKAWPLSKNAFVNSFGLPDDMGIRRNGDGGKSTGRILIHLSFQQAETLINDEIIGVPGPGGKLLFYICRDSANSKLLKQKAKRENCCCYRME